MNQRATQALPPAFSDLEQFTAQWCNSTMEAQYAARLASSIPQMQPFYDALKGRLEAITEYLDAIPFEEFSDADRALGHLAIAWVPVAEAIEVFKQTRVPDSKGYWELVQEPTSFHADQAKR